MKLKSTLIFTSFLLSLILLIPTAELTAQCSNAPNFSMKNPKKVKGLPSSTKIGDQWIFASAAPGIDVYIEILVMKNATISLAQMDASKSAAGQGYDDAWQPYVSHNHKGNDTSYLEWKIFFKKAGTQTDTVLPCLAVTAVDVDGDSNGLKEFIEAGTPGGYAIQTPTTLTVSFDGIRSKAIGRVNTINLIDSSRREAMFQMNFVNVSSIVYRNGAIASGSTNQTRHTSIFFRPFFMNQLVILPIKLLDFTARETNGSITIDWLVDEENEPVEYTVQRSADMENWQPVEKIRGNHQARGKKKYQVIDKQAAQGKKFYRLKQTDEQGRISYSKSVTVNGVSEALFKVNQLLIANNRLEANVYQGGEKDITITVHSLNGMLAGSKNFQLKNPNNSVLLDIKQSSNKIYVVTIRNFDGEVLYQSKIYGY